MGNNKNRNQKLKEQRLGEERLNNQGYLMKIIEYENFNNIIVEFQDEYKAKVHGNMERFKKGNIKNPNYRLGEMRVNKQGCLMKVIEYNNTINMKIEFQDEFKTVVNTEWRLFDTGSIRNPNYGRNVMKYNNKGYLMKCIKYNNNNDIIVEFQDEYKARVHTVWNNFEKGTVRNPYHPSVYNIGIIGNKYPVSINKKITKEYNIWYAMMTRCYNSKFKRENPSYKDVTCCEEWLLFENFYEWLHSQENFDKWLNGDKWAIDKDIISKRNKIYSPETCCLVPIHVNNLFTKNNIKRGNLPIGVSQRNNKKYISIRYDIYKQFDTPEEAFYLYKTYKETYIKQIAQEEYSMGNITKKCYDAMMSYEVEITD